MNRQVCNICFENKNKNIIQCLVCTCVLCDQCIDEILCLCPICGKLFCEKDPNLDYKDNIEIKFKVASDIQYFIFITLILFLFIYFVRETNKMLYKLVLLNI
jgi:hypothetical protein